MTQQWIRLPDAVEKRRIKCMCGKWQTVKCSKCDEDALWIGVGPRIAALCDAHKTARRIGDQGEGEGMTTEGWMSEKRDDTKRYHYMVGDLALCGRYGLYRGALQSDSELTFVPGRDCAACNKQLVRRKAGKPS